MDISLRFCMQSVVFTADIYKMNRHVAPKYRQYQHILWKTSLYDKIQEFELNTVTYGVGTAPYLALWVLK